MSNSKILFLTLIVSAGFLGAQEPVVPEQALPPKPGVLFVETDPFGAFIRLESLKLEGKSKIVNSRAPALIRDLIPGEYTIDVWKDGHRASRKTVTVSPGGVTVANLGLVPEFVATTFPGEDEIYLTGQKVDARSTLFLLPNGQYRVAREEGVTQVSPVFPGENQWAFAALGLGVASAWAGANTWNDISDPWSSKMPLSPTTVGSYAVLVADAAWFVSLTLMKIDYENNLKTGATPASFAPASVQTLYTRGESAQTAGQFELAAQSFLQVLEYYPDSPLAAEALFRLGRIHTLFGRFTQAETEYRLIASAYPLSSIWDRTQKALSDLAVQQQNWDGALGHLDQILFVDPLVLPEDVEASRKDIQDRRGSK